MIVNIELTLEQNFEEENAVVSKFRSTVRLIFTIILIIGAMNNIFYIRYQKRQGFERSLTQFTNAARLIKEDILCFEVSMKHLL